MLTSMGFTDIEENLRRLKKFKENHVQEVIDDYVQYPVKEEAPPKISNESKVNSGQTLNDLVNKLPAHEQDTMKYLINTLGYPLENFYEILKSVRKHKGNLEQVCAEL